MTEKIAYRCWYFMAKRCLFRGDSLSSAGRQRLLKGRRDNKDRPAGGKRMGVVAIAGATGGVGRYSAASERSYQC